MRLLGAFLLLFATLPVAAASATESETISAQALTSHECNDTEWHFVITGLDSADDAPASISVTWADGGSAAVPLEGVTGGAAHYRTTAHLSSTVTGATAEIYAGWSGQFNLSHGPCGTEDGDGGGGGSEGSVAATAPTVAEDCDREGAVVTITATAHVTYRLNGDVVSAGEHFVAADVDGDYTANVTAEAKSGFTITGTHSWNLSGTLDCETAGGDNGTTTISAKALTDHECDDSEWHFVITGLESDQQAPASITVTFSGGTTLVVGLEKVTGGTAHYRTTEHLDLMVTAATAAISGEWSGQFNVSHGPCGEAGGEAGETSVSAMTPTVTVDCTAGAVIVTIPATLHVTYALNGSAVTAGTHVVAADSNGDYSVTVTAAAAAGFTIVGQSSFTFSGHLSCGSTNPPPGSATVNVMQQPCTSTGASSAVVHIAVSPGSTPAAYSVTRSVAGAAATTVGTVTLPDGGTRTADISAGLVEDVAVRIVVSSGSTTLADVTLVANCTTPGGGTTTTVPPAGGTASSGAAGGTAVGAGGASTGSSDETDVLGTKTGRSSGGAVGSVLAATGQLVPLPLLLATGLLLVLAGLTLIAAPRRVVSGLVGRPGGKHHRR